MAWQEVQPDVSRATTSRPAVRVRATERGGLTISVHEAIAKDLGWRHGTTLTLLVGGGNDAAGKIALKPKPGGPVTLAVVEVGGGRSKAKRRYGKIYVGHFPQLVAKDGGKSIVVADEQYREQLIITLPTGWLKA